MENNLSVEVLSPQKQPLDALEDNLTKTLQAPKLDPILLAVANDYLANQPIDEIASTYGLSPDRITKIIEHKDVKSYITQVFLTQGYLNRNKRLALINQVIEKKLEESLETGILSKIDLLYWMKHLQEIENAMSPKKEGPAVAIQVNNNYESLMKDLTSE